MKLHVPDLRKEEGKFISYKDSLKLDVSGNEDDPVLNINLQATCIAKMILIKGHWETEIEGECSRCLGKTRYVVEDSFYEEFKQLNALGGEPVEQDSGILRDEGEMFVFRGDTLDLKEYFRQSFLMSQPLKILCHSHCKGLCPICGTNRNYEQCNCLEDKLDPRWELLQKLKEKQ